MMCNSADYFDGECSICHKDGKVRHKNIWLIGSEGIDICWPCEKALLRFLEDRKRKYTLEKLEKLKAKAKRKRSIKK